MPSRNMAHITRNSVQTVVEYQEVTCTIKIKCLLEVKMQTEVNFLLANFEIEGSTFSRNLL